MSWGKVGAKKRSDSLRTDKLQGEKRGREQGREGGGGGKRERERGGKLSEERSLSLSLSFCLSDLPAAASSSSCLLGFSGCQRLAGGVSACFSPAFRI